MCLDEWVDVLCEWDYLSVFDLEYQEILFGTELPSNRLMRVTIYDCTGSVCLQIEELLIST